MPQNKRPTPRKSTPSPEEKEDALIQQLCDLAITLAEREEDDVDADAVTDAAIPAQLPAQIELNKIIRKCLHRKQDDILYEALERSKYADIDAWQMLKESIAEDSEVTLIPRAPTSVCMRTNAASIRRHSISWSKASSKRNWKAPMPRSC